MKYKYFLLALLCLATLILGGRMLIAHDFYFLSDQGRDFLLVKDIAANHHLTLIGTHSGLGGVFHGPLWLYLLTPIFLLGRGDPFYFAVFYALIPIIGCLLGFFLYRKIYDEKTALIFAFIFAFSPSIYGYISNTIGINFIPIISIFLFYFLIKFIRGEKRAFLFLFFFTGLLFQFETAIALGFLPVIGIISILNYKKIKSFKNLILGFIAFGIPLSNFVFFDLRHSFLITKSLLSIFSGPKGTGYLYFPQRISAHIESLASIYNSFAINDSPILVFFVLLIVIFFATNYKKLSDRNLRKELSILFVFPVAVFIVFIFYPYKIWHEYTLGLTIPVFLGLSLIIANLVKNETSRFIVIGFIGITLLLGFNKVYLDYRGNYKNSSAGSYLNQKKVVDFIFEDSKEQKSGYFVFTPETFTYGMDYLVYQKSRKSNLNIVNTKENINYIILYPANKKAHDFFIKNVVKTSGKVLKTITFPGDIIVEKVQKSPQEEPVDPNYYQNLIFR